MNIATSSGCSSSSSIPPEDGLCLVCNDVHRHAMVGVRCACRHCRFKKCLAVGMSRDAIQQNRDPIGYTKRTRRYPLIKQNVKSAINFQTNTENLIFENKESNLENNLEHVQEDILMQSLMHIEKYVALEPVHSCKNLTRATLTDYQYWHEREWILMIELAKCIPMALLRYSAITYPSLLQTFYTPDLGLDTIAFPNGAFFDRTFEPERKFVDADDLSTEYRTQISDCRSSLSNALYRYMIKKRGMEEGADHFGKVLLLGTVIATLAVEAKEAVVMAEFFEQIHFSTLAKELLFTNTPEALPTS